MIDQTLIKFLNLVWLRPENALTMTIRSKSVKNYFYNMRSPSVDISGGDGTFSFLTCGGVLNEEFDVFGATVSLESVRERNLDIYDYFDIGYKPRIITKPKVRFDYHTDWKKNLQSKAKKLNFYKNTVLHDNNKTLPFESKYFNFIYSNSAYWIKNISLHLAELHRVVSDTGVIALHIKNNLQVIDTFRDNSSLNKECKKILDRGRTDTYKSLTSYNEWKDRFVKTGFEIQDIIDIGLRPLAPSLIEMANSLDKQIRNRVKRKWVEICHDLLRCLAEPNLHLGFDKRVAEHLFILKNK